MKQTFTKTLAAIAVAILCLGGIAYAADTTAPTAESHEEHHPKDQVKETAKDPGMMGSMKMDDMQGMMHKCMEMHKDGKMCEHQTMEKCEANMKKGECKNMMKHAKAQEKKEKTKK